MFLQSLGYCGAILNLKIPKIQFYKLKQTIITFFLKDAGEMPLIKVSSLRLLSFHTSKLSR